MYLEKKKKERNLQKCTLLKTGSLKLIPFLFPLKNKLTKNGMRNDIFKNRNVIYINFIHEVVNIFFSFPALAI